jgi:hypothetical protein
MEMEHTSFIKGTVGLIAALAISFGVHAGAAQQGTHDHGPAATSGLQLDKGRKWATDEPLRQGMSRIQSAVGARLGAAHAGKLTSAQYGEVANEVTGQVAYIVQNCKLEPAADAVLHVIIADLVAGADVMQGKVKGSAQRTGFVKVVQALDNYAAYFEHPQWRPLKH